MKLKKCFCIQKLIKIQLNTIALKGYYIFFGSGDACKRFIDLVEIKPKYIFDNSKEKLGTKILDIEIINPQCINNISGEFYIITTSMYYKEIAKQLETMGLREVENYIYYDDLLKQLYIEKNKNAKQMPGLSEQDYKKIKDQFIQNNIEVQNISLDENELNMFAEKYDFGREYIEGHGKILLLL